MNLEIFKKMAEPELRKYIEFLLWHYRVADAFWFIYVGEQFDQSTSERINERVWAKAGGMGAKDIISRFNIKEKGLKGFAKAIRFFPWVIIGELQVQEFGKEVIITAPACSTQVARLKRGLNEFDCKEMHRGEFTSFANEVDDRIRVECIFAPPDIHPDDMFCKWRFFLEEPKK